MTGMVSGVVSHEKHNKIKNLKKKKKKNKKTFYCIDQCDVINPLRMGMTVRLSQGQTSCWEPHTPQGTTRPTGNYALCGEPCTLYGTMHPAGNRALCREPCSLIPRPCPAFCCLQHGRAWYIFSCEHEKIIDKWQKKFKQSFT